MTDTPAAPETPATGNQGKRRRLLLIGLATVLVGGAVSVPIIRAATRPFVLDTAWGAPTVIDVGSNGDPLAVLKVDLFAAPRQVELGELKLDPKVNSVKDFESLGDAATMIAGTVPAWFPTFQGAVQLSSEFHGDQDRSDKSTSRYTATQLSLMATNRPVIDIGAEIRDRLEDTWPEVDVIPGPGNYSIDAADEWTGRAEPGELEINLQTSPAFPGLVIVRVHAEYVDNAPLRVAPQRFHGIPAEVAATATASTWMPQTWATADGLDSTGKPHMDQAVTWSVTGGKVVALAEGFVAQLGMPLGGNADQARAVLRYRGGYLNISTDSVTTLVRWGDDAAAKSQPGPLADLKPGLPAGAVELKAKPLTPVEERGEMTPRDAIAQFNQVGMPMFDGAVVVRAESGARVDTYGPIVHTARQVVVVETPLSVDWVGNRVRSALGEIGAERNRMKGDGMSLSETQVNFSVDTPRIDGIGEGTYDVEVGSLVDYPGTVAVSIKVTLELDEALPPPPAFTADYFAPVRKLADPAWTPSAWSIAQYGISEPSGAFLRGELNWTAGIRGPAGLEATLATVQDKVGVELESINERMYEYDEGDEDWLVRAFSDNSYGPVDINWSGKPVAVKKAG